MLFILPLFKLSIQICLIALFSTAVLRLPGGFGSEWEERGGVRASKQKCPRRLWLSSPSAALEEGQLLRGEFLPKAL